MASLALTVLGALVAAILVMGAAVAFVVSGAAFDRRRFKRAMRSQRYDLDPELTPWTKRR